jgi:hypothetical protein
MKFGLLLWILIFTTITVLFAQEASDIYWRKPDQLTLNDFKKDSVSRRKERKLGADRRHVLQGFIFTGIRFQFEQTGKHIEYTVQAYMNPDESWLRKKDDVQTLMHEQGHFNITEIYARKIRKEISKINDPQRAKKKYRDLFDELLKTQKRFDADNKDESGVSDFWIEKINDELLEYSPYSDIKVIIN